MKELKNKIEELEENINKQLALKTNLENCKDRILNNQIQASWIKEIYYLKEKIQVYKEWEQREKEIKHKCKICNKLSKEYEKLFKKKFWEIVSRA